MQVAGIFSGIGGLELGLEAAGHDVALMCEIDPAAQAVLRRQFSSVPLRKDVRALDRLPRKTELVAAGFPCQDLSQAGDTRGIDGRKSGVVRAMLRLLKASKPPYVLIENVPFMLKLGRGQAIRYIVGALELLGYEWAYRTIDTRAFGIPQRRQRVFLIASLEQNPADILFGQNKQEDWWTDHCGRACGFYWTEGLRGLGWAVDAIPTLKAGSALGIASAPAIWMPDGTIGTPDVRDVERLQGFPENWTKAADEVSHRRGVRLALVGNAVTVQVAKWIGRRLNAREQTAPASFELEPESPWPSAAWGSRKYGRHGVNSSEWPVAHCAKPIREFLRYELRSLSVRATAGFLDRLERSRLNRPSEFDDALRAHLSRSQ